MDTAENVTEQLTPEGGHMTRLMQFSQTEMSTDSREPLKTQEY